MQQIAKDEILQGTPGKSNATSPPSNKSYKLRPETVTAPKLRSVPPNLRCLAGRPGCKNIDWEKGKYFAQYIQEKKHLIIGSTS